MSANVLMVYIEPTPYIVGLIDRIEPVSKGNIDVYYLGNNLSQKWDFDGLDAHMLPDGYFPAIRKLKELIRSGRYDVLHLAGWGHKVLAGILVFAARHPIAVVVESDTPPPIAGSWWKSLVKRVVYPWLFRVPAMFLPGGTRQARYLRQYGVPEKRIRIANMTVDTPAITDYVNNSRAGELEPVRSRLGIKEGGVTFLFVGRVEEHKGVLYLVQAFEVLQQACKDANLLIVGDGTAWQQINEASSGNDGIVLTGRLSGNDLLDAYAVADVFVLPSSFEPWGLVVNEAMSAGLPVIVSERVGCVDDLVVSEETGLLVKVNSVESLSMTMSRLNDNSELRYHMSLKAREHIKSWTLENEAEIIVKAWEGLSN